MVLGEDVKVHCRLSHGLLTQIEISTFNLGPFNLFSFGSILLYISKSVQTSLRIYEGTY